MTALSRNVVADLERRIAELEQHVQLGADETREALERQTATADILKVIARSPADVQPVFEAIAVSAKRLLGGFSSTVVRFIDGMVHLKAYTPTSPEADEVLKSSFPRPVDEFAPFQMGRDGEVTQIPDTEGTSDAIIQQIARARGFRSMLFAPLMNKGTSIGLIAVTRLEPGPFVDHHVQLLQTFADQAVIAIENVRLFNETREALAQQTATSEILAAINNSAGNLAPVFDCILEKAHQLCGAPCGSLQLYQDDRVVPVAVRGMTPAFAEFLRRGYALSEGIRSALFADHPMQRLDMAEMLREQPDEPSFRAAVELGGIRTIVWVPLLKDGVAFGRIIAARREVRAFDDKQIATLQGFAAQAVIAIENARLLQELRARTDALSQSLEHLRTAQDRLIQTEKLASLGQLTAGIAHEIKNPLNFVNNFAALSAELTEELNEALGPVRLDTKIRGEVDELTGMLKDNLQKVVQHGKRADSIVKNMLLHSREGSGEHRPTDVNALVEESLNLAYHGARAEKPQFNVTLERELDPNAGTIEAFPQEITRVLLNLIANGFYAVAKRKAEHGEGGFEPVVKATTLGRVDHVEIRIRDNGTGIAPDVQEKMFNPFFTTKPAGEGTGLGLSMSHDIVVKQHGGTIDITTCPGEFTEFTILLPRTSNLADKTRG